MSSVAVIDYGMGNLHSVAKALVRVAPDQQVQVTGDANIIRQADRVIFPGVGAIRDCMLALRDLQLEEVIREVAASRPLLAVCVGMQALMTRSEENGGVDCLDLFAGEVRRFGDNMHNEDGQRLKVPHMGWNRVAQLADHPLWDGIDDQERFYFVHSYHVQAQDDASVAARCDYGLPFAAALYRDNIFATQFHPEKSQHNGLRLLANFLSWDGNLSC